MKSTIIQNNNFYIHQDLFWQVGLIILEMYLQCGSASNKLCPIMGEKAPKK